MGLSRVLGLCQRGGLSCPWSPRCPTLPQGPPGAHLGGGPQGKSRPPGTPTPTLPCAPGSVASLGGSPQGPSKADWTVPGRAFSSGGRGAPVSVALLIGRALPLTPEFLRVLAGHTPLHTQTSPLREWKQPERETLAPLTDAQTNTHTHTRTHRRDRHPHQCRDARTHVHTHSGSLTHVSRLHGPAG